MARPLRIQYPGAFYHITSRGNERKDVFKSKRDREKFLSYLASASERYNARIHVYCLMGNHYHLILETPDANLSQIMQHINGAYTTYFNTKRKRAGHLFQGRYKAIIIEADEYATQLSRYIHLNPVRAGIVEQPSQYPWSSYQFYTTRKKQVDWLVTDFVLGYFGRSRSTAKKKYCEFVVSLLDQEYESPLEEVVASTILGSLGFVKTIQEKYLDASKKDRELPALMELIPKKTIKEIINAVDEVFNEEANIAKKAAIYLCHRYSGRKLKEIGSFFNVGESAVSQTSRRFVTKLSGDKKLKKQIEKLNGALGL